MHRSLPVDLNRLLSWFLALLATGSPVAAQGPGVRGAAPDFSSSTASGETKDGDPVVLSFDAVRDARGLADAEASAAGRLAAGAGSLAGSTFFSGDLPEGDLPSAAAFTADGATLIVAHRDSKNLILLEAATRTFVTSIALSGGPQDVAVTSDGLLAVTANLGEDTVSIVDLASGLETAVVPVGSQPAICRITPDGTRAVVANGDSDDVSVIDLATGTELHRISGAGFVLSASIALETGVTAVRHSSLEVADDDTAIAVDYFNDEIVFLDLVAGTSSSLASAPNPRGIDLTPGGGLAVVAHDGTSQTLSLLDPAAGTITKTIATGIDLRDAVAVRPDGSQACVAVSNGVVFVDLVTDTVSGVVSAATPNVLAAASDGVSVLAANFDGSVFSFATQTEVSEVNLTKTPYFLALSPVGSRGIVGDSIFSHDVIFADVNGAASLQEGIVPSGAPPEADRTRRVAVAADGSIGVATNVISDTATVFDPADGTILGIVPVGDRPNGVAITPDASLAVVANLDSTFVSVIDLGTLAVTNITTSTRNAQVVISPDGQYAYVSVVVADGVWRIDLNTLTLDGSKVSVGEMSNAILLFLPASGMALSNDGATLVTCDTFDDTVTVVDTASWSVVATVTVGDGPLRAVFAPDDSEFYVSNYLGDDVSVVSSAGGSSMVTATVAVGDIPYAAAPSPDGSTLYVCNSGDDTVSVVDLASATETGLLLAPESPQGVAVAVDGSCVYVASGTYSVTIGSAITTQEEGYVTSFDAGTLVELDELALGAPAAQLVFDDCGALGILPIVFGDGLARVETVAPASATPFGSGVNPPGSLTVLSGSPALGETLVLGIDNPTGGQAVGSFPALGLASAPDPAFPAGTLIPNYGMGAPNAPGELLIGVTAGNPFRIEVGAPWAGPGNPAPIALAVPLDCTLLGIRIYAQGLLFDLSAAPGTRIGLSEALFLDVGF